MLSEAEAAAQVQEAVTFATHEPRVNVTRADLGRGCPNPADPTGQADSTCALNNAIRAAETDTLHGAGFPVLYIPHGRYKVSGQGYHAALALSTGVSLVGDGAQSTVIFNASPHAATLRYSKAQGNCNGKVGACLILIHGITFTGTGHQGTGGLIELDSTDTGILSDVVLANTGGIALNLQGSSERWIVSQVEIDSRRRYQRELLRPGERARPGAGRGRLLLEYQLPGRQAVAGGRVAARPPLGRLSGWGQPALDELLDQGHGAHRRPAPGADHQQRDPHLL
jgi:hypothetical protein